MPRFDLYSYMDTMLSVRTALLLHTTPTGRHYDWLVGTPGCGADPRARLWTARVDHPSERWQALGCFELTVLAPHRSAYLDYQGPISDGRGHVTRVDQGHAVIERWLEKRIDLDVRLEHFQGRVQAREVSANRWRAKVIGQ